MTGMAKMVSGIAVVGIRPFLIACLTCVGAYGWWLTCVDMCTSLPPALFALSLPCYIIGMLFCDAHRSEAAENLMWTGCAGLAMASILHVSMFI